MLDNRLAMHAEVTKRIKEGASGVPSQNLYGKNFTKPGVAIAKVLSSMDWSIIGFIWARLFKTSYCVSAKKIVGLPVWPKNLVSLQPACIDPTDVFIEHHSQTFGNGAALRWIRQGPLEINYARWTSGSFYTNQIKNKFVKYPRINESHCRFGCQDEETPCLWSAFHLQGARQNFSREFKAFWGRLQEVLGFIWRLKQGNARLPRFLTNSWTNLICTEGITGEVSWWPLMVFRSHILSIKSSNQIHERTLDFFSK